MLNFAALVPHPPVMISEVGGEKTKKVKKTITAMKELAGKLAEKDPETLIFITPHGPFHPEKINIAGTKGFRGDLRDFGADIEFELNNDLDLAHKINQSANQEGIPSAIYQHGSDWTRLDHGVTVPLYYLTEELGETKIVLITYSSLSRNYHFAFGELISQLLNEDEKNVSLIASGDLSHRLNKTESTGYSRIGKEFDKMLITYLKEGDLSSLIKIDQDIIDQAGECGYQSLIILLGAIGEKDWQARILSYEGPFGIGYGVVNFKFK